MSSVDERYDRYAAIFENAVTAESIELGNRVLHWLFMENFQASTGRLVVEGHARKAGWPEKGRKGNGRNRRAGHATDRVGSQLG